MTLAVTPMDLLFVLEKIGLALGLGLLVGMQRERAQIQLAGIRTFALITVFGAVCALLSAPFGGWVVAAGALAVALLLVAGNLLQREAKIADPGLTTEIAALLMYALGAYVVVGHAAALAIGGGTALLLHWKDPMHAFIARIGETDLRAIMQFVLVAVVILPVLPDVNIGPYEAFNPHKAWFMVVLIVAISLSGYVAQKWLGARAGPVVACALGGLISSTAATVSYSRRATAAPQSSLRLAALVLMIATTVAQVRVLVEIAVVAPGSFLQLAAPLGVFLVGLIALSATMFFLAHSDSLEMPEHTNPAELKSALIFGGLYALVTLAAAAARDWFGSAGLYLVAVLSGLHDLGAITLSTAQLVDRHDGLDAATGWRVILAATMSNLVVKGGIAGMLGNRRLFLWMVLLFGIALAGGGALLLLWPTPALELENAALS